MKHRNSAEHKAEMARRVNARRTWKPTYTDMTALARCAELRAIRARTHNRKGELQR